MSARVLAASFLVSALFVATSPGPHQAASSRFPGWRSIGPHPLTGPGVGSFVSTPPPYAGRVTAIATDPHDPHVAYIGAADGGVWKSADDGRSWTPLFDQQPSLAIGALAVDPRNARVVYAGTGEANLSGDAYPGAGLFGSHDGGGTWRRLDRSVFDDCRFADLMVWPTDPDVVLAAVFNDANLPGRRRCAGRSGVYRSVDEGSTWTRVLQGFATDLAIDPSRPAVVWAGVVGSPLWRSGDGGATWTRSTASGLPTGRTGRIAVAAGGGHVYLAATDPFTYPRGTGVPDANLLAVRSSTDGGASFYATLAELTVTGEPCQRKPQCPYDFVLTVDPRNASRFYLGTVNLLRFDDSGATFENIVFKGDHHFFAFADFHALTFDAAGRLWLGSDGGVYRTSDAGATYDTLNADLAITQFYCCSSGLVRGRFVVGAQDHGFDLYTGSDQWRELLQGDGGEVAIDPTAPDIMYAAEYAAATVYKTTDGGAHWSAMLPEAALKDSVFPYVLAMDPSDARRLYAGSVRVWATSDGARTWTPVSPRFQEGTNRIETVAVSSGAPSTVYVGDYIYATSASDVEVTVDRGRTWTSVAAGLPPARVAFIVVDPVAASGAYIGFLGYGHGHVFATQDRGAHWQDISSNLPDTEARSMAVDPRTKPATLFVGTDAGVYRSADGGRTWARFGAGLPNAVVNAVSLDPATGSLFAATHGRGAWMTSVALAAPTVPGGPSPAPGGGGAPLAVPAGILVVAVGGLAVAWAVLRRRGTR